jgi:hypothetical protein
LRLTAIIFFRLNTCDHSPYVTSSLKRGMGLSFTTAAGPRQRSHSQTWGPNLEGQVPIFIPQKQVVPVILHRHWVPFPSPFTTCGTTVDAFDPASTRVSLTNIQTRLGYDLSARTA